MYVPALSSHFPNLSLTFAPTHRKVLPGMKIITQYMQASLFRKINLFLAQPPQEKSQDVKSGLWRGHSLTPRLQIHYPVK